MAIDTRKRLLLVDPTTQPDVAEYAVAPRLRDLSGKRLGLIDDSKVNAKELLHEVADVLNERYGVAGVKYHRKPADPKLIREMAEECDYVVVGVGD